MSFTTISLLTLSLAAIWLLLAAPIGRRSIRLARAVDAPAARVVSLLQPMRLADWNSELLSAKPSPKRADLLDITYKAAGRKGEPIHRTLAVTSLPTTVERVFAQERRVVDDSVLATSFWKNFSERRIVEQRESGTCHVTIEQVDRYRGIGGYLMRRRWMARELEELCAAAEQRAAQKALDLSHPALQVALAILSTLMLWPFFGRNVSGLMMSTILTLVIVMHELGHMAAYRAFGHERVRMLFVPILGGVAIGGRPYDSRFEAAACALMGPGLSAFFVPILLSATTAAPPMAAHICATFLLVLGAFNLLNLLPMSRFDGGQVLRQLCPNKFSLLAASLLASAMIVATGWYIGVPPMILMASLAVFTLLSLIGGQSFSTRTALEPISTRERWLIGLGLYGTIAVHAIAVAMSCDLLLA